MSDLFNMLYNYAAESRERVFSRPHRAEEFTLHRRMENSRRVLSGMGPEADAVMKQLIQDMDELADISTQGMFLAGLAIGLELGGIVNF